jgi:hypothetical protein
MNRFAKVFFLAGSLLAGAAAWANDYLPLAGDDLLRFVPMQSGESREMLITATQGNWKRFSDFLGLGENWVYTEAGDSRIWVYNPASGYGERMVDLAAPVGQTFLTPLGSCSRYATIADRAASLETPAGSFDQAIRVDFSGSCSHAGLRSVWFVAGIGPVQWSQASSFGLRYFLLAEAAVGEVLLPQASELIISATLPLGRIVLEDQPAIHAALSVHNPGPAPVELVFPSGQTFDIYIIDEAGQVVRQFSHGQLYTQALYSITLAPNASHSFGDVIDLVDNDGEALDVGTYVLRVELSGFATPEASVFRDEPIAIEAPLHVDRRIGLF